MLEIIILNGNCQQDLSIWEQIHCEIGDQEPSQRPVHRLVILRADTDRQPGIGKAGKAPELLVIP